MMPQDAPLTSIEICAGAGGQALGLERAGFRHAALVELDEWACATLRANRPAWPVLRRDVRKFVSDLEPERYGPVGLVAGGVPCPPFSVAGRQMGHLDDRDLFPVALELVDKLQPDGVMLENVRGLLSPMFEDYRAQVQARLSGIGYWSEWKLLNASDFGVPQLRPRAILVALRPVAARMFEWPTGAKTTATVGQVLRDAMAANGWPNAEAWADAADEIAPTLVGGSHRHGGPDLGPTRARQAWAKLGVDGISLADSAPTPDFQGSPRLTVAMAALLQGFPANWRIQGRKTAAYRQVGNAFPPPVAEAVGTAIAAAIRLGQSELDDHRDVA